MAERNKFMPTWSLYSMGRHIKKKKKKNKFVSAAVNWFWKKPIRALVSSQFSPH